MKMCSFIKQYVSGRCDMEENYMFDTENTVSVSKNMIVVCYDISDNKRRNKMVKLLERYLFRVQRSVFEAMLTNQKTDQLKRERPSLQKKMIISVFTK